MPGPLGKPPVFYGVPPSFWKLPPLDSTAWGFGMKADSPLIDHSVQNDLHLGFWNVVTQVCFLSDMEPFKDYLIEL